MQQAFDFRCTKCGTQKRPDDFPKGHRRCVDCAHAANKSYCFENADKIKARTQQHRAANPELVKRATERWRAANPDKVSAQRKKWMAQHPDYYARYSAEWYAKNGDHAKESSRNWRAKNPGAARTYNQRWHVNNAASRAEYAKQWKAQNPAYFREYAKQWLAKNGEKAKRNVQIRRARKSGAQGLHTSAEWLRLVAEFGGHCVCCKKHFGLKKLTKDHVVPLSSGGSDFIENIQPLCFSCNSRKGNRHSTDYRLNS